MKGVWRGVWGGGAREGAAPEGAPPQGQGGAGGVDTPNSRVIHALIHTRGCFIPHSSTPHFQEHEELLHSRDVIRDLRIQV